MLALCNYEVIVSVTQLTPAMTCRRQMLQSKTELEDAINSVGENLKELIKLKLAK
jgi:hypothetical protein